MNFLADLQAKVAAAKDKKRDENEIFVEDFSAHAALVDAEILESVPRKTIIRMLQSTGLNENFTFKTERRGGRLYILAMRAVLSRVRNAAERDDMTLDEFKLYVIDVKMLDTYDEVTLVRTKSEMMLGRSVYGEIFKELAPAVSAKKG